MFTAATTATGAGLVGSGLCGSVGTGNIINVCRDGGMRKVETRQTRNVLVVTDDGYDDDDVRNDDDGDEDEKATAASPCSSAPSKTIMLGLIASPQLRIDQAHKLVHVLIYVWRLGEHVYRAGKLFSGPHLYAGLGIVALISVMTVFCRTCKRVRTLQEIHTPRDGFFWQAKSGMNIVLKLLKWR